MKKVLVVGHSHILALKRAASADESFEFYSIQEKGMDEILNANADAYLSIALLIRGNHHNNLGLINHPQPFDFYLPENTNLPIRPNAQLLPVSLVANAMKDHMKQSLFFDMTSNIVEAFRNIPIYQICSPPPLPEMHIRKHPSTFKEKIDELGVSPAIFRYKLWHLYWTIAHANCAKLGITFVDVPKTVQNKNGLLHLEYCNTDPTHANDVYGNLVLNQIRALNNMDIK
ncbi:MAG: hypothetical protein PHH59_04310 [Methylovulum sp.]|uniref:hypothetical protein n=1 Tax=Methylovulum sp. TaxID=1916980 RepID=UPI0026168DF2|nr:hypothetical protein [Methylovulum sp.]MDD2723232.1 hypothetical protein [Methylovulum sp.]MDD5123447.1 hypothetical protein [Methylovulum sp.]